MGHRKNAFIIFMALIGLSICVAFGGTVTVNSGGSGTVTINAGGSGTVTTNYSAGGGGGGGTILVGDDSSSGSSTSCDQDVLCFTWDGDFDGSGDSPYVAENSGTVAKAVIGLAADATPSSNGKVCVYDSSKNLIGCCSGSLSGSANDDYELTTCDSISITSGTGYYLGFIPDDASQNIVTNSTGTFKVDTDNNGTYASPPDPFSSVGNTNTGWPRMYVTD